MLRPRHGVSSSTGPRPKLRYATGRPFTVTYRVGVITARDRGWWAGRDWWAAAPKGAGVAWADPAVRLTVPPISRLRATLTTMCSRDRRRAAAGGRAADEGVD